MNKIDDLELYIAKIGVENMKIWDGYIRKHWNHDDTYFSKYLCYFDFISMGNLCSNTHRSENFFETHIDEIMRFDEQQNAELYSLLSENTSVGENFYNLHSSHIDWSKLSHCSDSFFEKHIDRLNWAVARVSEEFLFKYKNRIVWTDLCKNRHVPAYFFEANLGCLVWSSLCSNIGLGWTFFAKYIHVIPLSCLKILSKNEGVQYDQLLQFIFI